MENKYKHVLSSNGRWVIKEEGNENFFFIYDTKEEAVYRAMEIARRERSDLFVHTQQGKVEFRRSYENDQYPANW